MSFGNSLLDELATFMKVRIVLTAAALDFFTCLDQQPASAPELAVRLGTDSRATRRILDCLVGFGLVRQESGACYGLTESGMKLSSRHPDTILPMVLHMNTMWDGWSHLTETIRTGADPNRVLLSEASDPSIIRAFIGAMHVIGKHIAPKIAAAYDLKDYHCLLDIGGGSAVYTVAFLERYRHLRAVVFDLPFVLPLAEEKIVAAGLRERIRLLPGDFYKDELPAGCDCALLSAIIHQNSPEQNVGLFKKIYKSLDAGGCLLIRDHIMEPCRTRPVAGAVFAINMLIHTPGGDTYTFEEVREQLDVAGFTGIAVVCTGEKIDCLVEAHKPR